MLRRVEDLEAAAASGSTAGIPLLHPWANRLAGYSYRVAGREAVLDPSSPLLHLDAGGLPMHGVPWSLLAWEPITAKSDFLKARLQWSRSDFLALFPFPHDLEMAVSLLSDSLTIETTVVAGHDGPVPVSFGFHPYFGLPDLPRALWRLAMPAMRKLVLNPRGIPTGMEVSFDELGTQLGELDFDDAFALIKEHTSFSVAGGGRRITVEFLAGYAFAQVYAPKDKDYIALEPMTAPANALVSGRWLRVVPPGERFRAGFRVRVEGSA
jgi:aldose 1-epimerase